MSPKILKEHKELALKLLKAEVGILSTTIRDEYLTAILDGVVSELTTTHGIELDFENQSHLMFVVNMSSFRYEHRDRFEGLPINLQFRLHNLIIESKKSDEDELE